MKRKIMILFFALMVVVFLYSPYLFAFRAVDSDSCIGHPGRTDRYGCHTCRTNCPSWGLEYGQYHCH